MAATAPELSVVIPSYGTSGRLPALLAELRVQEAVDFEIVVIDDGSPEPLEDRLPTAVTGTGAGPSPRIVRTENQGVAAARNRGVSEARAPLICFVDDDMEVPAGYLAAHRNAHHEGRFAVVADVHWRFEAAAGPFGRWYLSVAEGWSATRRTGAGISEHPGLRRLDPALVTTQTLSLRKEDFRAVGGFDEGYGFPAVEDQDLALRLDSIGVPAVLLDGVAAVHHERYGDLAALARRQELGARETARFTRRWARLDPDPEIRRAFGRGALREGRPGAALRQVARGVALLPGVRHLLRGGISALERTAPEGRLLHGLYRFWISAHAQRGWRRGVRDFADVAPFDPSDLTPASSGRPSGR